MKKKRFPSEQSLLAEYAAANSAYLAYDGYRWQAGSFLVAGVFVYWGFLIGTRAPALITTLSSVLIASLMSCWILFAHHYRQLYLFKLLRLQEIEAQLGMEQHRRFVDGTLTTGLPHRANGPAGHNVDLAVYVLTSIGGVAIVWARIGELTIDLLVIPLVMFVTLYVRRNERRIQSAMTLLRK
jgi:hypothetical protein